MCPVSSTPRRSPFLWLPPKTRLLVKFAFKKEKNWLNFGRFSHMGPWFESQINFVINIQLFISYKSPLHEERAWRASTNINVVLWFFRGKESCRVNVIKVNAWKIVHISSWLYIQGLNQQGRESMLLYKNKNNGCNITCTLNFEEEDNKFPYESSPVGR